MMNTDFDRKLDAALAERDRLAAGGVPDPVELAAAPFLGDWIVEQLGSDGHIRFSGQCVGHPRIRDGWVHTSAVVVVDPDRKWIRTMSRYYRLGDQNRE